MGEGGDSDKMISAEEVAKHSAKADAWFTIHGIVYDVTNYLEDHPGGEEVMLDRAGLDASTDFEDVGHSEEARKELDKFAVGKLEGYDPAAAKAAAKPAKEGASGGSGVMGVLVPVVLVGAAIAYRFLM
jgi:cytochrome b involved in lipid metabolism